MSSKTLYISIVIAFFFVHEAGAQGCPARADQTEWRILGGYAGRAAQGQEPAAAGACLCRAAGQLESGNSR